jgi:hypothetical protein
MIEMGTLRTQSKASQFEKLQSYFSLLKYTL